jgi:hypothetical protein
MVLLRNFSNKGKLKMYKLNLYQKLNNIQKEVQTVFKGTKVQVTQSRSYTAVSHDDVAGLLHLPMANAGVFTEVDMTNAEVEQIVTESTYNGQTEKKVSYMAKVWVSVSFVNADLPSERFIARGFSFAFDSSDKAVGKALSYAVKNIYLKNFNLESTDNEESRDAETTLHPNNKGVQSDNNKNIQGNQNNQGSSQEKASPKQISFIQSLYGKDYQVNKDISKEEASKLIKAKGK